MNPIATGFGLAILLAGATIYQWVDEDGNRHYSDRKPDVEEFVEVDMDERSLSTYRAAPAPAPVQPAEPTESEASERSSRPSTSGRRDERERYCEDLLQNLDAVQDQLRRGYREPRGQQLRDRRRELRAAYRRECV